MMTRALSLIALTAALFWLSHAGAQEKPIDLPDDPGPSFATVLSVDREGVVLHALQPIGSPRKANDEDKDKKQTLDLRSMELRWSPKADKAFDGSGRKLDPALIAKRLKRGDSVMVVHVDRVEPAFAKLLNPNATVLFVAPPFSIRGGSAPSEEEKAVLDLTNAERKKASLPALKWSPKLAKAARLHSENMANQDKLEHELDGKSPADRVNATGYKIAGVGENIAAGQRTPDDVVQGWMNSPGHRANILKKEYTELGVGLAPARNGMLYWTQVFGISGR